MLIAIEGIDGAGKTSTARLLEQRLAARGLRVHILDRDAIRTGDAFIDSRLDGLRTILWPSQPEPASDPLGTHFYLFLLAAWFSALGNIAPSLLSGHDVVVMDRSWFRVVAKAHVRSGLDVDWLMSLFAAALTPDLVVLLDVDPTIAWGRRAAFKATELGRWDGFSSDAGDSFRRYQGAIRATLRRLAQGRDWLVVTPAAADTAEAVTERIEAAVMARLGR
jgi:thymidylate kinase